MAPREDELAERVAAINATGTRLIGLVRNEFPKVIDRAAPEYRMALISLVARLTGTMEAILHLADHRREADLSVLVRTLYDHTTTLGWLASDPVSNYPLWKSEDARQRVKVHDEWKRRWDCELLQPGQLRFFQRIAAEQHSGPTSLVDRAGAADDYWRARLGFPSDQSPFIDHYQTIFRQGSSRIHASLQGLNDVTADASDSVVVMLEPTTGDQALPGRGVVIYALGLKVSAATNGFPGSEQIEATMAEYNTRRWGA